MPEDPSPTNELLRGVEAGDRGAPAELYLRVEDELRRLAVAMMRSQPEGHTLQPTALVHEAWIKLGADQKGCWRDHGHFVATAASAMRQILVDHARAKASAKRGGSHQRQSLEALEPGVNATFDQLLALDDALAAVAREDERARRVAEMRLFGGLELREIAASLGLSPRTIDRVWQKAQGILRRELGDERVG